MDFDPETGSDDRKKGMLDVHCIFFGGNVDKVYGGITITKGRTRRRHDQDGVHGVGKERGGGSEEKGVRKSERKT